MGNNSSQDIGKIHCLVCQKSTDDTFCNKCKAVLIHIQQEPDDRQNTQLILNRMSIADIELVKNIGNHKCQKCQLVTTYILRNLFCTACEINKRLQHISSNESIKIKYVLTSSMFNVNNVKIDGNKTFMEDLISSIPMH